MKPINSQKDSVECCLFYLQSFSQHTQTVRRKLTMHNPLLGNT